MKKPQSFLVKVVNLGTGTKAGLSGTRLLRTRGLVLSRLLRLVEPVKASAAQEKDFSSVASITSPRTSLMLLDDVREHFLDT